MTTTHPFPAHVNDFPRLRWLAVLWLFAYLPSYAYTYGYWHFLFLCNVGICLTAMGLLLRQPLLLASQAVAAPAIALLWGADAATRLLTGMHLHGGTAYMWDGQLPLWVRSLSLYHLAWPVLLAYCLSVIGYDRRGWRLQSAIATAVFAISLFVAPAAENLNYVRQWPGAVMPHADPQRAAAVHLLLLVGLVYWPTHRLLMWAFRRPAMRPFRTNEPRDGEASPGRCAC